jgi:four helix bundle suffix protein
MVQAARSGKQNIAEASVLSGTSKEAELKLTNVARASLEELLIDYKDYLRTRKLIYWDKSHKFYIHLSKLHKSSDRSYQIYQKGIESDDPEVSANVLLSLTNVTSYLLAQQIKTLERAFLEEGGLRERMSQARMNVRKKRGER